MSDKIDDKITGALWCVENKVMSVYEARIQLDTLYREKYLGMLPFKYHKKDGADCGDCGLFNVIKGEMCKCEWNDAVKCMCRRISGEEK